MRETPEHYSMKYSSTFCYFPSRSEWGYVSAVNGDGLAAVSFLSKKENALENRQLNLAEVPYKAPPVGWLYYEIGSNRDEGFLAKKGALLFVRQQRRTFKCGISISNNYIIYWGVINPQTAVQRLVRERDGMTAGQKCSILSALNRSENIKEPRSDIDHVWSKNFSYGGASKIYWRDLEVGEIHTDRKEISILLQKAVMQEFMDQVPQKKLQLFFDPSGSIPVTVEDIEQLKTELL